MKSKITFIILMSFLIMSCSSVPKGYKETSTKNIYEKYDEFGNFTIYQHCEFFDFDEPFSVYIIKEENRKYIRAVFTYTGDDWIFFDTAVIMNREKDRITFKLDPLTRETDTYKDDDELKVFESIDVVLTESQIENLYNLCKKEYAKMQLSGKSSKNYGNIDDEAVVELLDFFNSL